MDMIRTWLVGSLSKTKDKNRVDGSSTHSLVGMLDRDVASNFFYKAGTVKFVGSGWTLRSPVERVLRKSNWLDQNADWTQILVLQNYLFFGNAQSVATYI
jgi:hypothetical protein